MIVFDPTQLLNQAAAAANDKDYGKAIALYTELLDQTSPKLIKETIHETRLTALRERGRLFTLVGQPEAALAGYEQYYVEAGNSRQAVDALVSIGNQCTYMNLTDRALEAHRDALRLAESLHYTAGRAMALGGMGLVYSFIARSEDALPNLRKSLSLFERIGDKVEQARSWNRIGGAHVHLGEVDKAIKAFQNSFRLAQEAGEMEPISMETAIISLNNLGECYQSLFDMEQALIHHRRGLEMAERVGLPYLEADLSRNLGFDLCNLDFLEQGIYHLERSLQLSLETNQPDVEVQALYSLALVSCELDRIAEAIGYAEQLKALAERAGNQGSLAEALHVLGLCRLQCGDVEGAKGFWHEALFLAHETGRRMLLWRLHAALAQISTSQELSSVHTRIASEIIQQIARPIEDDELRGKFMQAKLVHDVFDQLTDGDWGDVAP